MAAVNATGIMASFNQFVKFGGRGNAIVTRENNQGIFLDARLFYGCGQLAHVVVDHHDKIGIGIQSAFALPFF